jgi:hypothetical protein
VSCRGPKGRRQIDARLRYRIVSQHVTSLDG